MNGRIGFSDAEMQEAAEIGARLPNDLVKATFDLWRAVETPENDPARFDRIVHAYMDVWDAIRLNASGDEIAGVIDRMLEDINAANAAGRQ